MTPGALRRYWVFKNQLIDCTEEVFIDPDRDERTGKVYLAADVEARDKKIVAFLKDFIEWNACNEKNGVYRCNQCDRPAIAGQSNHDEDCEILEAYRLVRRMEGKA